MRSARRDEAIVATKFGGPIDEERKGGASAAYIERAVEDSLRRLGTDRIDLYQLHFPDAATPFEETLGALDELVRQGKVLEIGGSNFSAEQIDETTRISADARPRGSSASRTSTACCGAVPSGSACSTRANATASGSSRTSRLRAACSPASTTATRRRRRARASRACPTERQRHALSDKVFDRVEALDAFARDHGHTLLELAIAWLLARPTVASVIAGATKPEQVAANAAATGWTLTDDDLGRSTR